MWLHLRMQTFPDFDSLLITVIFAGFEKQSLKHPKLESC